MKSLSIRLQLSLMMSFLTLVIITVLSVAAYVEFKESLLGNVDATLKAVSEGIRAQLDEESPGNHEAELRAIVGYDRSGYFSQCRVWVEGASRDLFTTDSPDTPLTPGLLHPPAEAQPKVGDFRLFNVPGEAGAGAAHAFRTMWMRQVSRQQIVNILVARSSSYVYHEVSEFLCLLLVSGSGVTLAAFLLVPRIVSFGLRSVAHAGQRLEQVTHRNLAEEGPIMGDVPVELRPFQSALEGMLVRLNQAMRQQEQLTADSAHELRTPLAIVKSTLQTLRMRPRAAAEYEEGVDDALQDIERMERLVSQLLTLARLDAVDEVADPAEVRLDVLLESLAEVFGNRAEQQGAGGVCVNGAAASVPGDETELRQLFGNLLDNALRYGPPDGVVRVTLENGPGEWVTACIHDDGGTIPPENLPHLFDRFYRVDPSRSQTCGGTGLGLAIARQIVQRHRGTIAVTSDARTGTSVVVQLPRL